MSHIYDVQLNEDGAELYSGKYPVANQLLSDQALSLLFHSQCDSATLEVPPGQKIQDGMVVPTATTSDRAIVGSTRLNERELGYPASPHNFQGPLEFLDSTVCFPSHVFMSPPDVTNPCTRYPESYRQNTHQPASVVNSQARGSPDEVTNTREGTNPSEGDISRPVFFCEWKDCPRRGPFLHKSSLLRHLESFHVSPRGHPCPVEGCEKVCNRDDNLKQHMRNIHALF